MSSISGSCPVSEWIHCHSILPLVFTFCIYIGDVSDKIEHVTVQAAVSFIFILPIVLVSDKIITPFCMFLASLLANWAILGLFWEHFSHAFIEGGCRQVCYLWLKIS